MEFDGFVLRTGFSVLAIQKNMKEHFIVCIMEVVHEWNIFPKYLYINSKVVPSIYCEVNQIHIKLGSITDTSPAGR